MRVAVVSDIHGNRHAFEAVLDQIAASECRELWCLGDLVGYGADPDACVELAREHAAVCLAGNHDLGVTGAIPLEQFSRGAALAATWTQETIQPATREYLEALEPQRLDEAVGLYHASPRDPVWEYVLSPLQAELCLDAQDHRIGLIGHSHVALSFSRFPGIAGHRRDPRCRFRARSRRRASGSSIPAASASHATAIRGPPGWSSTSTAGRALYRRTDYDIAGAAAAIRAARLPDSLAERLLYGQ